MHIVITGGLGYIGSRIVARMHGTGHQVTILDNLSTSVVHEMDDVNIQRVDLRDESAMASLDLSPADCLMHLAGPSSGPASAKDPVGTISDGYRVTYNTLELAARLGVKRFLNASSMTVYGNVTIDQSPIKEDSSCLPISHYAIGKVANERLVDVYCSANNIGFNSLRMFNVYGEGQDLTRMDQGLVSIFTAMLLKSPRIVSRGTLDRFRDIVDIEDVVTAWELCATQNSVDGPLNIGSGVAFSVIDLITTIADELSIGDDLYVEIAEGTPGDIHGIYADISNLRAATGYQPAFLPDIGVRRFTRWAQTQVAESSSA